MLRARGDGAWFAGLAAAEGGGPLLRGRSPAMGGAPPRGKGERRSPAGVGGALQGEDPCRGERRSPAGGRSPAEGDRVRRSPAGLRQSVHSVQVQRRPRYYGLCAPPASGLTWTVALWPSQAAPLCQTLSVQTQGKRLSSRTQCSHGQGQKQRSTQTR